MRSSTRTTVRIVLKKPKASFLTVISQAFFAPVSPKAVKELGAEFGRQPVGTGPFKFVEWVQNQHVKLARNPDYNWGPSYLHKGPGPLRHAHLPPDPRRRAPGWPRSSPGRSTRSTCRRRTRSSA